MGQWLFFVGAGLSRLQIMDGALLGLGLITLPLHAVSGGLLLLVCLISSWKTSGVERRMSLGNVGLVLVNGVLGIFLNQVILLVHLFLALGVLANFSVMFGMERGAGGRGRGARS